MPTVILMGGYAEPITDMVDAFEVLFRSSAGFEAKRVEARTDF